ncbi:hypothetical protein [Ectobacillus polymachus]|uniref:hypothetical protein n=1 Tax=Ectobacillus polymachus TaxID=1508806 RepID=UPI003A8BB6AD
MKKLKFLLFATVACVSLAVSLGIITVFATTSKETSANNDPLTQFKTAPEISFPIQNSNDTEDPAGYWTKEKMENAIPEDGINNGEKKESIQKGFKSPSIGEPTNISDPVAPESSEGIR